MLFRSNQSFKFKFQQAGSDFSYGESAFESKNVEVYLFFDKKNIKDCFFFGRVGLGENGLLDNFVFRISFPAENVFNIFERLKEVCLIVSYQAVASCRLLVVDTAG